jgi:phosphopantetheine adenylyltransferase
MNKLSVRESITRIKTIDFEIEKLKKERKELVKDTQNRCKHLETFIESDYHSGNYLDTDYTIYTKICKQCGKEISTWTVDHGCFG